jgi:hypothetical protein
MHESSTEIWASKKEKNAILSFSRVGGRNARGERKPILEGPQ